MNLSDYKVTHRVDFCVIGGGMAGICAAVSAARHGARVVLMQDRPVLGGNASSECRMCIRGAASSDFAFRESGIIQEIELENIYRNPTMNYSIWDSVLYEVLIKEPNVTLLLNCSCLGAEMDGNKIRSVTGWQLSSYTYHTVYADIFADCSGDSILADLSGAPYRVGREGKAEFDEYGAPDEPDRYTMGSSCLIEARETDHKCEFIPPEWAYVYPDDESMYLKNHDVAKTMVNFWWIELGGEQDTIKDAQKINEELIKTAYGVWDHIKNRGDHGMENWELEWIGFLPGKRESRRYTGAYTLTQRDLEEGHLFRDAVAYGGWTMDNHSPKGFQYSGYSSVHIKTKAPYQIPFRSLYSQAVPNLMFAGRNISATHMAMSSTRVMATCAVMGQAVGTGAALAAEKRCLPHEVTEKHIDELQRMLLLDGCYIPGVQRPIRRDLYPLLTHTQIEILTNGHERPQGGDANTVSFAEGSTLTVEMQSPAKHLRLALDPDFSRESISDDKRSRIFAMRTHLRLSDKPLNMPAPLLRSARLAFFGKGRELGEISLSQNRAPRLFFEIPEGCERIEIQNIRSWGGRGCNLFACELL